MNPETLGAFFRLGMLQGELLPTLACELLEAGHDTQALRELAGMDRPTLREANPVLDRVLCDLGVAEPRSDDRSLVAREIAHQTVTAALAPERGAYQLGKLWQDDASLRELGVFYALWDEWDEYPEQRPEVEAAIIKEATTFLQAHGPAAA